jgi:hypothetical protein
MMHEHIFRIAALHQLILIGRDIRRHAPMLDKAIVARTMRITPKGVR